MNEFINLSEFYDSFSDDSYYDGYLKFIITSFNRYSPLEINEVLDLCCGTGQLSKRLYEKGYDIVCVDKSIEMLNKAKESCPNLLLLNQDMIDFELYGTVQGTVCTLDSLNYLSSIKELEQTFFNIANYTEKDGIFIFDVNTKYRYQKIYGENDFVFENEEGMLIWRNSPDELGYHIIDITLFVKQEENSFFRIDESQRQLFFEPEIIEQLLNKTGFETIGKFSSLNFETLFENNEKYYYIAKRI